MLEHGVAVDVDAVELMLSDYLATPAPVRLLAELTGAAGWSFVARAGVLAIGCAAIWPDRDWAPFFSALACRR